MDVLSSKPISAAQAAKLLQKFVDAKQEEVNADLMVRLCVVCCVLSCSLTPCSIACKCTQCCTA